MRRVFDRLARMGAREVELCRGYGGRVVYDYVKHIYKWLPSNASILHGLASARTRVVDNADSAMIRPTSFAFVTILKDLSWIPTCISTPSVASSSSWA